MIKLSTINTPLFTEAGLSLSEKWSGVDLEALTPEARDMLELHLGRIVQVHEYDLDAFIASTGGLEMFEGKLRYPAGASEDAPPIGQRWQRAAKAAAEAAALAANREAKAAASKKTAKADEAPKS